MPDTGLGHLNTKQVGSMVYHSVQSMTLPRPGEVYRLVHPTCIPATLRTIRTSTITSVGLWCKLSKRLSVTSPKYMQERI